MTTPISPMAELLRRAAPLIPVLKVERVEDAAPLARALVAGGLPVMEVTLRTAVAYEAIAAMQAVEGAVVGAGTVTAPAQLQQLRRMNVAFAVSPGSTPALLRAGMDPETPFLPGISSASDIMEAMEAGYDCFKFFPAHYAGGPDLLRAFAGPFPNAQFCPTGGISLENAGDYLTLKNVLCVGGSWLTPRERVAAGDWAGIGRLASEAVARLADHHR